MADDNHTSISHLVGDDNSGKVGESNNPQPSQNTPQNQQSHSGTSSDKEHEPARKSAKEDTVASESSKDNESQNESQKEKSEVKEVKKIPDIPEVAKNAGVSVAPSAKPFPTIYDVKVPIYTDEQIENNLHKSFWTGAKWLAEICKYILWQSHIKLVKVGKKVIRRQT